MSTETKTDGIKLSSEAAEKVASLLAQEGRDDLSLRVAVQPGHRVAPTTANAVPAGNNNNDVNLENLPPAPKELQP